MSINTAHTNNGVLLHAGESILLFCDNVTMHFSGGGAPGQSSSSSNAAVPELKGGDSVGRLYLTTHRMIFNNKKSSATLKSFSFPFVALRDVELEQPIFGANYIKGKVIAQPNGNFQGEVKFKLHFKSGGAIDFGTAMLKAAQMASRHFVGDAPPPYTAPSGPWYAAPPPAYTPNPQGYMGWVPPTNVFPEQPPPNSVYMTDAPPPYPGINGNFGGYVAPPPPPAQSQGPQGQVGGAAAAAAAWGGAMGAPPPVQTGYYDPNAPHMGFVPPPTSVELPPSYDESTKKKN